MTNTGSSAIGTSGHASPDVACRLALPVVDSDRRAGAGGSRSLTAGAGQARHLLGIERAALPASAMRDSRPRLT